jgi:hypothetical protein
MTKRSHASKRRRWRRFKNRGGAIVMLHKPRLIEIGKPRLVELGPIIDISMGGLAFQYIENRKRSFESDILSVKIPDQGMPLENFSFEVISDTIKAELPDERRIRTRCVKFTKLTPYQSFQLETFIKNHTSGDGFERRSGSDRRYSNDPRFDDEDYSTIYERRADQRRRKT